MTEHLFNRLLGSDSDDPGIGSEEELRKRHVQSKYLRLRRLTAELRGKDIELAKLLEDKMRIMSEMLAVVGTPDPLKDRPPDYVTMVRMKEESREQSTAESRGSRSSLGGGNNYTKEQLLSAVQASRTKLKDTQFEMFLIILKVIESRE